jgi:hypothetical protein
VDGERRGRREQGELGDREPEFAIGTYTARPRR